MACHPHRRARPDRSPPAPVPDPSHHVPDLHPQSQAQTSIAWALGGSDSAPSCIWMTWKGFSCQAFFATGFARRQGVVVLQAEDVGVGLLTKPGNAVEGQKCSASEQKGVATVSAEGVQQRIFSSSKMRSGCGRPCTMIHSQGRCKLFRSTDPPEISRPFVALALVSVSLLVLPPRGLL